MGNTLRKNTSGITLVELLVVLGIFGVLAAGAFTGMARIGVFSRDELQRSARELYSFVRAASIYAGTYNVDTAVVYAYDNPGTESSGDSVVGGPVRALRSVAMYYYEKSAGNFVPVPDDTGEFQLLTGQTVVLLNTPFPVYNGEAGKWDWWKPLEPIDLGMLEQAVCPDWRFDGSLEQVVYPAHVFSKGSGALKTTSAKERYTVYVAPHPTEDASRRLIDPENPDGQFVNIPVQIYKSTGRVRIAT